MNNALKELRDIKDSAKGFAGLMSLYEQNYVRFNHLVSNLDELHDECTSIRAGDTSLYLQVLERCRYTTTVLLTYRLEEQGCDPVKTPDLKIRLYHDARQAEVMSCCRHDSESFQWLDRSSCRSALQWRWRMNQFLYKWLNYCLKKGHHFPQLSGNITFLSLLESIE